jgi:cullin 3
MGNADVRVSFDKKAHDLNVSTFALVILLLFEDLPDDEFLTYEVRAGDLIVALTLERNQEIKSATSIIDSELQRHLQSLACAKYKILKKHPPSRDVDTSDSFSFNREFSSDLRKIKISTVVSKVETGDERKETRDRIDEERRHQIEVRFYLCALGYMN